MSAYQELAADQLRELKNQLDQEYKEYQSKGLKLDMSRGKPAPNQLDLSMDMLDSLNSTDKAVSQNGTDCRNYGLLDGIPEAKKLMADMLDVEPEDVIVGGNSSLNLMYDTMARAMLFGVPGSEKPWFQCENRKFLCPSPGYDRHFAITEEFGFEMITVPMLPDGPDMDMVESFVKKDESIKGIWCVPMYSNPQGITYSDETIRRLAALKPAAKDFRIFCDNAYGMHHLYDDDQDHVLNLLRECRKAGSEDMVYIFGSTSKVSFPGAGISAVAASALNLSEMKKRMSIQTIGPDKLNQLRHVLYYKDVNGVNEHMRLQAQIIGPKFQIVLKTLKEELGGKGIAQWTNPKGGYFIALDTMDGCAKRVVQLCKEAGVVMTPAGATFPYGVDPQDRNIRIAPTYPSVEELTVAAKLFCLCVKLASVEKLLSGK